MPPDGGQDHYRSQDQSWLARRQRGYIRSPRDRGTELDAIVRFEAAGPAPLTRRRTIRVDKTHDPRAVIASVAKPSGVLPPPTLPVWPRRVPQKPGVAE